MTRPNMDDEDWALSDEAVQSWRHVQHCRRMKKIERRLADIMEEDESDDEIPILVEVNSE